MTAAGTRRRPWTRADFLAWEAQQDERWEFVGSMVRMMAGGTIDHNMIAGNIFSAFRSSVSRPCRVFQQNMKLVPSANDDVTYPDVMVVCGQFAGSEPTVPEATVVVEVVSKSSRGVDYVWKWETYQEMPQLRHYLVVEQNEPKVVMYSRGNDETDWRFRTYEGLSESIELAVLGMTLAMNAIYADTDVAESR
jgi:Uma2 family endonuclease